VARLRYVKDLGADGTAAPGGRPIRHKVRSVRALYETEPEIARALLPRPLVPAPRPEIFVQFANVAMHFPDDRVVEIGAATVGVACSHEERHGYYVLAMPMEGEFVVIGGREKYGEPKKIADTEFTVADGRVNAKVTRHGIAFLELDGAIGDESDSPKEFTEYFYCYKALPAAVAEGNQNGGFDGEVLLTLLTWERNYDSIRTIEDGRIILRESPHDPLIDVPVKRLIQMELAEGGSRTRGEVLRSVPGEWLAPFLSQRYDDPQVGIDVPLASEEH
jgi:acetoacetate decarboxylase